MGGGRQTDKQIAADLAKRMKNLRLKKNLTQQQVAEMAGIHYNTLSKFEQGQDITLTSFIQIVRALGELPAIEELFSEAGISPIQILKNRGKKRERASGAKISRTNKDIPEW